MRLHRKLTKKEWKEIGEKYKNGGVHMYRGKLTYFYNGEELYDYAGGWPLVYDSKERLKWKIIVLPGVKVIPEETFKHCENVETVIMSDSVKRVEDEAFRFCESLVFVRLSKNIEFIGTYAFHCCESLTSIFIPESCAEIRHDAFRGCKKLIILGMPQDVELGCDVFQKTALIKKSTFELDQYGQYDDDDEEEAIEWIQSINNGEAYALHRTCSSFNPLSEVLHDILKRQGIQAMRMKNSVGVTPSQYLAANTFADISEKEIINQYILDMMGEIV